MWLNPSEYPLLAATRTANSRRFDCHPKPVRALQYFDDYSVILLNPTKLLVPEPLMALRRSEYDVTNRVNTTDPRQVFSEVRRIYEYLYQRETAANLNRAFDDLVRLYRGEIPGY